MSQSSIPFYSPSLFPGYKYVIPVHSSRDPVKIHSVRLPESSGNTAYLDGSRCPEPILLFEQEIRLFAEGSNAFPWQPTGLLVGDDREAMKTFLDNIEMDSEPHTPDKNKSLVYSREISRGKLKNEKAKAFQTIEGTFCIMDSSIKMLHPFGIAASYSAKKKTLELHIPTQWPGHVRNSIASALEIDEKNIIIHPLDFSVQGPVLEWIPSLFAVYTAMAAIETNSRVLMELSPHELGRWLNSTGKSTISISTGLDKEGKTVFLELSFTYDVGGLYPHAHRIIDREVYNAGGRYNFPTFHIKGEAHKSWWPGPKEPRMGYTLSPVIFALESHLNRLAEISQMDPCELKKDLLLKEGQPDIAGVPSDKTLSLNDLIDRIKDVSDFSRKHAANELLKKRRESIDREMEPLKGIGLAVAMNGNGLFGDREHITRWKIRVTLNQDNTVAIETSGFLGGSSSGELCRHRTAEILGFAPEAVRIIHDPSPPDYDSGPSSHGRNASVILDLVEGACHLIQKKRFRDPLPISVIKTTAPPRKNRWNEETFTGNPFPRFSYGACVVETELDPVDFLIKVRNVWMMIDAGPITDRRLADSTLRGGIQSTLLSCYGPRILKNLPAVSIFFHSGSRISLSSSLHELPSLLVPPAFISALSQASGSFLDSLPLSTELIDKYTGNI